MEDGAKNRISCSFVGKLSFVAQLLEPELHGFNGMSNGGTQRHRALQHRDKMLISAALRLGLP
jgi:hypothetical protein